MKEYLILIYWLLVAVLFDWVVSTGTFDQLSVRAETPGRVGRTRSEIDLETEKSVIVCAGQNKSLECVSPGSSIAIREAFWGRLSSEICPSEDGDPVTNCLSDLSTTPIVRKLCDDKEYCEIPARHSVLQPPGVKHCPGVNKYLAVKYTCIPEKRKFVLCNGETTELTCGQGWKIHVISAYWGRDSPSTCPTPLGKFFTCANSADSMLALKSRCSEKERCIVTADDQHLTKNGEHCPGIDKYAVISYKCQPSEDEANGLADHQTNLLGSEQYDAAHSSLDLTSGSKSPTPQSSMGELNLSMLLPVPQGKATDKLKPIIEFLGSEPQGKNSTTLGENLPIPKDSQPTGKEDSKLHVGIAPLKSISSSSASKFNSADVVHTHEQSALLPGKNDSGSALSPTVHSNHISQPDNHNIAAAETSAGMLSNLPPASNTQELVKTFLTSNFGQALAKGLLGLGTPEDSSYKNLMAQHFGSSVKPPVVPTTQIPLNTRLIENLLPGLLLQSSKQGTTDIKNKTIQNNKDIAIKQGSGSTNDNSLSSPVISIDNKVFALDDLSSALNNVSGNKSTDSSLIMGEINGNRKHSVNQTNKDQIKRLNDKIATLETLSDALDALTAKLSSDESTKSVDDQKHLPISLYTNYPNLQEGKLKEQYTRYHHLHHHRHHHNHRKSQFDEDMGILGALLSGDDVTQSSTITEQGYSNDDKKDSNDDLAMNGQKLLNTADLDMVQSKINQAIEMAEAIGQQNAHTRENVAKIRTNSSNLQKSHSFKENGFQRLQNVLTGLVDDALRRGTIKDLIQKWNSSGSPFAGIAQNISLFLQSNSALNKLGKKVIETGFRTFPVNTSKTTVKNDQSKSTLLEGISGFDNTALADSVLFAKAVNSIIGILSKRQNFLESNSTNRSLYETTDTLTNFKGILLGGRISKIIPQEDVIAQLGRKIVTEILKAPGIIGVPTDSSVQENDKAENNTTSTGGINIDQLQGPDNKTLRKPLHDDDAKGKLTFSDYDTRNMSKSVKNTTLMEFMKSVSGNESLHPLSSHSKPGDKYSHVKPSDLMSAIIASLLDLKDTDKDNSARNKPTIYDDESENERLAHVVSNDKRLGDISETDAVSEASHGHAGERKKAARLSEKKLNSSFPVFTLPENRASDSNSTNSKDKDKIDSGDQTVTFTLQTVDDTSAPEVKFKEEPKEQTGLQSNKVPNYLNIQSATTLGKINSTSSKNAEHSFKLHQILQEPGIPSDSTAEARQPYDNSQSHSDGLPMTLLPSSENKAGSQTKEMVDLPLGLQMNAIGRIATDEDDDHSSVKPEDLSAVLTSTSAFSDSLGSKSAETKSFQDKPLPMVSDLFSTSDVDTGGETETIASKSSQTAVDKPIKTPPEIELPSASEVREMATSMKALLKVLRNYAKKLKLEDEEDSLSGQLPVRSKTSDNMNDHDKNVKEPATGVYAAHFVNAKSQFDENSQTSLGSTKYKYNNPYVNFPLSSPIKTSYVDSSGFENIQEQPRTELNSFSWNYAPEQVHAQRPLDSNPTKNSIQPQAGVEQWSPGREAATVAEELKDLNLPSIEDDPAVQAVQHIVAEENILASQKRKAIERHEQPNSTANANPLIRRLGIFGRNTIPKHKVKSRLRNKPLVKHKLKATVSKKDNVKMKPKGKTSEEKETSREVNSMNVSHVGVHSSKNSMKDNSALHDANGNKSHGLSKAGNDGKMNKLVDSRDNIPGSGNERRPFDSVAAHTHNNQYGGNGNKSHGLSMAGNDGKTNKRVFSRDDIPGSGNERRSYDSAAAHTHNSQYGTNGNKSRGLSKAGHNDKLVISRDDILGSGNQRRPFDSVAAHTHNNQYGGNGNKSHGLSMAGNDNKMNKRIFSRDDIPSSGKQRQSHDSATVHTHYNKIKKTKISLKKTFYHAQVNLTSKEVERIKGQPKPKR